MANQLIVVLSGYPHWVRWQMINGRKIPLNPLTGKGASSTDRSTWSPYANVSKSNKKGFVLTSTDPFTCLDLDHVINDKDVVSPEVTKILLFFESYTEVSPSGTGLHVWMRGKMPAAIKRKDFEFYSTSRYMTITGNVLFNCPLVNCQDKLDLIWTKYGKPALFNEPLSTVEPTDCKDDLRKLYRISPQFKKLWKLEGGFYKADGSHDPSSYDMSLAGLLRDWSIDRIVFAIQFFRSEHGFRAKHLKAVMTTIARAKKNT